MMDSLRAAAALPQSRAREIHQIQLIEIPFEMFLTDLNPLSCFAS
jgi:hypothetical protein